MKAKKTSRRRKSDAIIKRAVAMYRKAKTLREIGQVFGVSRQRIDQIFAAHGVKRRALGLRQIDVVADKVVRDFLRGVPLYKIAGRHRIAVTGLNRFLEEKNLSRRPVGMWHVYSLSKPILKDYCEGKSSDKLAKKYHISIRTLYKFFQENDKDGRLYKRRMRAKRPHGWPLGKRRKTSARSSSAFPAKS